ncbi:FMN-binding protein [Longivirga aurantiaca]|uniref:FMN-binding protein n=1 Tax=Longivirga aurantiaca TaxID=1837743 RepID=A0ABW1T062_9ACTN
MKRALLVSVGTVAGLATVLSYSDGSGDILDAAAAAPVASHETSSSASAPPTPEAEPVATPSASRPSASPADHPTSSSPSPSASASRSASPAPTTTRPSSPAPRATAAPTRSATPKPTPKPTPTRTSSPTPTPTPSGGDGEYVGIAASHRYGTVQVAITVTDGVITAARAVRFPTGESQRYSDLSIPTLVAETIGTTTAEIAAVSGATLTSYAWMGSLESAMAKAGL